jgi:IS5 family transposase
VDKAHKLIRKWDATDAAVHDSQKLDDVLDLSNTGKGVWADGAYRSVQIEAGLKATGRRLRTRRPGYFRALACATAFGAVGS